MLPGVYGPRSTAGTVLHHVVRTHLERFLAETAAATDGAGVPRFIEREFREFLGCGVLSRGFARVRCDACRFERLVPFSCKARAVCPSCGGRRMAEQAAHLVDAVLPFVPVRQWVLTVPHRLRYRDRGPQDVAGELLKPIAIVRRDGDVGVQVEAVEMGLAAAGRGDPGDARGQSRSAGSP